MACKPECGWLARLDDDGVELRIAMKGNHKFKDGTIHPMCIECLVEKGIKDCMEFKEKTLTFLEEQLGIKRPK